MNLLESILSSIVLSLSTNLDNLAVGISFGVRNCIVPTYANFAIAILSGLSTFISIYLGEQISQYLPPGFTGIIGSLILIIIGSATILQTFKSDSNEPEDLNSSNSINRLNLRDSILLGCALTLTNFGTGVGAGIAQFNTLLSSFSCFFSSLLTIGGGYWMGKNFIQKQLRIDVGLVAGLLLVILGGCSMSGEF